MKALIILGWLLLCPIFSAGAQNTHLKGQPVTRVANTSYSEKNADAILGEWLDEKKTVRIQVYKKCNTYNARIVWLKDESIARLGSHVLEGLLYTQKNSWEEGRIFYPRTNSWYDCRCTLHNPSIMKVRVYIGTPLLGKTIEFNRIESPAKETIPTETHSTRIMASH
ncbi:DUF2147 domain-containing protein [Xanthocytophaga flava]|uniref:DUF2147 domain-containing protein n=1 Tax=Xanthocytophaga flava TaxID=3048013 RepID=UPI0028D2592F|nr:DUF2147 domain-containing protein [Xanthocytophaga flavus]MDJ1469919.1 DUF2147 domain-containing protein [Xanthocytophaga flavus]